MEAERIARARLRAQGLWGARPEDAAPVLRRLVAMQGQEFGPALWSLGQRAKAVTRRALLEAFDAGVILRTHVLRPTWHLVAPDVLGWLMRLSGPRVAGVTARRCAELDLDARALARSNDVIAEAVAARPMTRRRLGAVLRDVGIPVDGQRLPSMLMRAELDAVVVSGPIIDGQHSYVPFASRVVPAAGPDGDEALALLAHRYFATRGPATAKDFAWWSGFPISSVRRAIGTIADALEQREVDGRTYRWAGPLRTAAPRAPAVDLIQCYDEALISFSESRDAMLGDDGFEPGRNTRGFMHAVLVDGRVAGRWRARAGHGVEVRLGRRLSRDEQRALDAAVDRYRRFDGSPSEITPPGRGP